MWVGGFWGCGDRTCGQEGKCKDFARLEVRSVGWEVVGMVAMLTSSSTRNQVCTYIHVYLDEAWAKGSAAGLGEMHMWVVMMVSGVYGGGWVFGRRWCFMLSE